MVTLKINQYVKPVSILTQVAHTGTVYELVHEDGTVLVNETITTDDLSFRASYLVERQYDIDINPAFTYTARARYILTPGGLQGWSNVVDVVVQSTNGVVVRTLPPQNIRPPIITTSAPIKMMPTQYNQFDIALSPDVHSEISSISYILADINGNVVEVSLNDYDDRTTITQESILSTDSTYSLKCMLNGSNNSNSPMSTLWFTTAPKSDGGLAFDPSSPNYGTTLLNLLYLTIPVTDTSPTAIVVNGVALPILTDLIGSYVDISTLDKYIGHNISLSTVEHGPIYYTTAVIRDDTLQQPLPYVTQVG